MKQLFLSDVHQENDSLASVRIMWLEIFLTSSSLFCRESSIQTQLVAFRTGVHNSIALSYLVSLY